MSATLALTGFGPSGATPMAGLLAWVASAWKQLRAALDASTATKQQEEAIRLLEFAGSRFGDPLLEAPDADALDDQLDTLLDSSDVQHLIALALPLALALPPPAATSWASLTAAVADVLGEAPTKELGRAGPLLAAWLAAQSEFLSQVPREMIAEAPTSVTTPDIPPEIADATLHALRLSLCLLAIVRALSFDKALDSWRATALVQRIVESAHANLRFLASVPGVNVPETIVPRSDRIDLAAIEARHERARATAARSLAQARTRLGS